MALDTQSQDFKRLENSLESSGKKQAQKYKQVMKMLEVFGQNPENTKSIHEAKFGELKDLISGLFCTNRALFYKNSNCLQKEPVQQGTIKLLIIVNMLQEHAWFVKEVTTPLRYIILNEISLILMMIMCTNGFAIITSTLTLKKFMILRSLK
jgi:hypothetical protein